MTPEEILNEAADIIRRDGWHQGDADDGNPVTGAVCLMGAISRAVTGDSRTEEVNVGQIGSIPEANEAVKRVIDTIGRYDVGAWNDKPERSVEDVLLALKRAAE